MLSIIKARIKQRHRTMKFPHGQPVLPARFQGLPVLDQALCRSGWGALAGICPVGALMDHKGAIVIDMGRCLFCGECQKAAPQGGIQFTRDYQLAGRVRDSLLVGDGEPRLQAALDESSRRVFGRSLKLRQVSAGGCNACEADCQVLNTVVFDLGRFGIQFVASPRHADGLLITGPVSRHMEGALKMTYEAIPEPKLVIAVGACAISGGGYADHPETVNGAAGCVPVDVHIPGCPPHPVTILDGLLRALGKVADRDGKARA